MKNIVFSLVILVVSMAFLMEAKAQKINGALYKEDLQKIYIDEDISLHFVSPEPIQYVDISTNNMLGDIPIDNVCRIKALKDSVSLTDHGRSLGVVTIVGQKYIAQYNILLAPENRFLETQVEILPAHTNPLDIGASLLSDNQLRDFALQAYKYKRKKYPIIESQNGISGRVNNIYTVDDYIFLDITYRNGSNLKFDMDQVRFKIEDRKILKATNIQSIEIEPVYQLHQLSPFKRKHRNIFVLKKFSFPNNKMLTIELTENQISGRSLILQLDYANLLSADTL